ncbi:MAG: gamma-glutamylcyclotransferase [Cyclobacteriaceae bacterium]
MKPQYIFFYGTLMNPDVYRAVTGKELIAEDARLEGYQIYTLKERVYPGIMPSPSASVMGFFKKIVESELDRLDWFEGNEYERRIVKIIDHKEHKLASWVYVLKEECQDILDGEGWDYEFFASNHLKDYLGL